MKLPSFPPVLMEQSMLMMQSNIGNLRSTKPTATANLTAWPSTNLEISFLQEPLIRMKSLRGM